MAKAPDKDERLAAALRDNLKRRKAQARHKVSESPEESSPTND
jgi:hypothetical protein